MDIYFGIKTEDDDYAYLEEKVEMPTPNLPDRQRETDRQAELSPPNLPGQEIKVEDIKIEDNDYNAIDALLEEKPVMPAPNLPDRQTERQTDRQRETDRQAEISSTKCKDCGFMDRQYIETRRQKILKKKHKKCIKRASICSHCGFKYEVSVVTRQQTLNIDRHNLCAN